MPIMVRHSIVLLALLFAIASGAAVGQEIRQPAFPSYECLEYHNAARKPRRLEPLQGDSRLMAAAQLHAEWMADRGRLSHLGPRLQTWFARAQAAGYSCSAASCSENICEGPRGHMNAAIATDLWLKSRVGHRDNVLGNWRHAGFGSAVGRNGQVYACALYANPQSVVLVPPVIVLPGRNKLERIIIHSQRW